MDLRTCQEDYGPAWIDRRGLRMVMDLLGRTVADLGWLWTCLEGPLRIYLWTCYDHYGPAWKDRRGLIYGWTCYDHYGPAWKDRPITHPPPLESGFILMVSG